MTADGSAHTRLLHALSIGNLLLVRANAAELGRVDLPEALAIVELIRAKEPERFDAAAVPLASCCWLWPIRAAHEHRWSWCAAKTSCRSFQASRETGQVMQCPPPRPRPSSCPAIVWTSMPAFSSLKLVASLRS